MSVIWLSRCHCSKVNGPVPTGCSANAWTPCSLMCFGGTITPPNSDSSAGRIGSGSLVTRSTVCGSITFAPVTSRSSTMGDCVAGSIRRWML
nr:hypothetical protein [Nonomuraea zeae]